MNMFDSLFSESCVLNEQIARQVFEIMPERGHLMVIIDREGHCWPSNSEKFSKLNISESFLQELCSRIDDGAEPLVTQTENCSIISTQLVTERTNCGYVMIALTKYTPKSTMANIELIEMLLNQVGLIARLIEKNTLLYELQMKQFSSYRQSEDLTN